EGALRCGRCELGTKCGGGSLQHLPLLRSGSLLLAKVVGAFVDAVFERQRLQELSQHLVLGRKEIIEFVDQVDERGQTLKDRLQDAEPGTLCRLVSQLREHGDEGYGGNELEPDELVRVDDMTAVAANGGEQQVLAAKRLRVHRLGDASELVSSSRDNVSAHLLGGHVGWKQVRFRDRDD